MQKFIELIKQVVLRTLFRKEYQMIFTDELTKLYNRRYLDKYRSIFRKYVFIDIDDFKRINDTRGHREGDRILQMLSEILRSHPEPIRLSGDEFVLVYRNDVASDHIMSFLRAIKRQAEEAGISLSAGISDSLDHADKAMYWVKRNGKNGIRCAE